MPYNHNCFTLADVCADMWGQILICILPQCCAIMAGNAHFFRSVTWGRSTPCWHFAAGFLGRLSDLLCLAVVQRLYELSKLGVWGDHASVTHTHTHTNVADHLYAPRPLGRRGAGLSTARKKTPAYWTSMQKKAGGTTNCFCVLDNCFVNHDALHLNNHTCFIVWNEIPRFLSSTHVSFPPTFRSQYCRQAYKGMSWFCSLL